MIKTKKNEYLEYLMKIVSNNSWETIYNSKAGLNDNAKEFESFILPFLDCIFKCNLEESDKPTEKAIDLFDYKNGIFVQVSTQSDRSKIEDTLKKLLGRDDLADINSLKFLFISDSKDLKPRKTKTKIDERIIELIENIRTKNPNFEFNLEKDLYFSIQLRKHLNSIEEDKLKILKDKFVNFDKAEDIIKRSNSNYRNVVSMDKKYNPELYSSPQTTSSKIKSCLNMEGQIELYHQVHHLQVVDKSLKEGINNLKKVIEKVTYWHDIDLPEKFKLRLLEISKSINFEKIKSLIEEANEHLYSGLNDQIAYDNIIAELTKNLIFDDSLSEVREEWDPSIKSLNNYFFLKESYDELKRECSIYTNILGYIIKTYKDDLPKSIKVVKAVFIKSEAGMGKTNFLLNICQELKKKDKPFIFILGDSLDLEHDLLSQIKNQFVLEPGIYLDSFFDILNEYAESKNIIIPILIDGLNESKTYYKWGDELVKIMERVDKLSHVKLIVSYRSSYENIIFKNKERRTLFENSMFSQDVYSVIKLDEHSYNYDDLILKYKDLYKTEITSGAFHLNNKSLLYIKMFFETYKNKSISLTNSDILEKFKNYTASINQSFYKLSKEKEGKPLISDPINISDKITPKLMKLGEYMWENKTRDCSLTKFLEEIEETEDYPSGNGILRYVISNSLINDVDYQNGEESIHFTYDLFAAYIIAEYLINSEQADDISNEFIECFSKDPSKQHPLYFDILRCFSILYKEKKGKFLHEFVNKDSIIYLPSINSLFEINQTYVLENEIIFIKGFFSENDKNKESIMESTMPFWLDPSNKWNFDFFSGLLKEMLMSKRDRIWTEFIRKLQIENQRDYFNFNCEKLICLNCSAEKAHLIAKLCLLTSTTTIKDLRYKANKALFKYSLKYPTQFIELLEFGINFNDPYVNETVVKVAYGVILQKKHDKDFISEFGVKIANLLNDNYFSKDGENHTTHIVIREYASNTILIVNSIHGFLTPEKIRRVKKPYEDYTQLTWQRLDEVDDYEGEKDIIEYAHGIERKFTENYSGKLLPETWKDQDIIQYRDEHKDAYFKITYRSNLVYGLNFDDFGSIDNEIRSYQYNSEIIKIKDHCKFDSYPILETYGQKYNLIAYFEYWGYLVDENKLFKRLGYGNTCMLESDNIYINRELNYDPTFPQIPDNINLDLCSNFNFKGSYEEWMKSLNVRLEEILELFEQDSKILNIEDRNDWVLLNGHISIKEDKNFTKQSDYYLNTILVNEVNYRKIKDNQDTETNQFEPIYLDLEFEKSRFIKEFDVLNVIDPDYIARNLKIQNILNFKNEKIEYQSLVGCVNLPREDMLIYFYHWVSYFLPKINLIIDLNLSFKDSHFIMYDELENIATKSVTIDNEENLISGNLLYIRKDLFEKLISRQKDKPLLTVWVQNSNKEGGTKYFSKLIDYPNK